MSAITVSALPKTFGSGASAVPAVDGIDLDIADGEFFSLLGPSGSGKTTVLRLIAGFEQPTSGRIVLGGQDVTRLGLFRCDVNTVFQDYALFPDLSVFDNVAAQLIGQKGTFSIRPEKIQLVNGEHPAKPDEVVADGRITQIGYAGAVSRIVVTLDLGPAVTVLRPNSASRPGEPEPVVGRSVRLARGRRHAVRLPDEPATVELTTSSIQPIKK